LPACPKCGNKETVPTKVYSVIVEPSEGERGLTERKVGMYTCSKCGTKFPTVVSRQKYLIVAAEQLNNLQKKLKSLESENSNLKQEVEDLKADQKLLKEMLERIKREKELHELEVKLKELESQVEYLRKEKGELERRVTELS
jgi:predicted RNase H-like nuclease (RuvC/YqgF family)